jgi:hypothetical protein
VLDGMGSQRHSSKVSREGVSHMRSHLRGIGFAHLIMMLAICWGAGAQEPQVTLPDTSGAQLHEKETTDLLITGTVIHEDGAPREGLQVVLVPWNSANGEGSIFFYPDDEGVLQVGNPNATTDGAGRFTMTVSRAYLEREETEFRIEYGEARFGYANWIGLSPKGSKEPLVLNFKEDVNEVDVGEVW